jgi:hypothetical protein
MTMLRSFSFLLLVAASVLAQPSPPQPPVLSSPVELFRKLLATNRTGREMWLATKPAAARQYVESKLREYEQLPASQREARLHALQMRWHMRSLMQMNPAERSPWLAALPEADRTILRQQLGRWDILPPPLKKDVLENENLLRVIVATGGTNRVEDAFSSMTPEQREELLRQNERWSQMPAERRQQISERFNQFFELREAEKTRVVAQLTESDREQMDKTLAKFAHLSKEEREQAMQGFRKFAELSPAEQALFLKTADRWKAMSETDKLLWRKVVAGLQIKREPPTPSAPAEKPRLSATN